VVENIGNQINELYERYNQQIINYIGQQLEGRLADAEDLAQEVWAKLLRSFSKKERSIFGEERSRRNLVYKTTKNIIKDFVRKPYLSKEISKGFLLEHIDKSLCNGPEKEVMKKENRQKYSKLIELSLGCVKPELQKIAFRLKYLEKAKHEDIARFQESNIGTVRWRVLEGKSKFKVAFRRLAGEEEYEQFVV
jgi:RNA polymerase sigma factor (sigma-70 family)